MNNTFWQTNEDNIVFVQLKNIRTIIDKYDNNITQPGPIVIDVDPIGFDPMLMYLFDDSMTKSSR